MPDVIELIAKLLVVIWDALTYIVEPVNVVPPPPYTAPLIDEISSANVDTVWKRPLPPTSNKAPGVPEIPIPTKLLCMLIVGVVSAAAPENVRAETPGSNTMLPVVCIRIRSDAEEPRNTKNSWMPVPVDCSARTVFEYAPVRPKNCNAVRVEPPPINAVFAYKVLVFV